LLTHPHLLGSDADEMDKPRAGSAVYRKQKPRESCQWVIASGEDSHIGPRVEIMFNRQQKEILVSAPVTKLGAISVLSPADTAQQFAIVGMKSDQIAAAAMIRTEDKLLRRQLHESPLDVACPKPRAIPTDRDNFVVAKLRDPFDRVLKPCREIPASLPVNVGSDADRFSGRREKMKIDIRRNMGAQARDTKKRPRRLGERTPRQVDVDFVGKYENGSTGHVPLDTKQRRQHTSIFGVPASLCEVKDFTRHRNRS
jgi:hypothetical protein